MRALITGITGQDGSYMAERLRAQGIGVIGLTRDVASSGAVALSRRDGIFLEPFDFGVPDAIAAVIERVRPDFIFNFAAKSTGAGMFDAPREMDRLNQAFPMEILRAIAASPRRAEIRFVQASSSEMYGSNDQMPQNELSPFRPISPYGAAKLYVHNMIGVYRETNGLHASSAILFNHESPRRGEGFVTQKIATAAARIHLGLQEKLSLGNISSRRDWGYAPEYVDAMLRMAQCNQADDYVIATGRMQGIPDLLRIAFGAVGLSPDGFVTIDRDESRRIDSKGHCGDASKIRRALGWVPRTTLEDIMTEMVQSALERVSGAREALPRGQM